MKSNKAEVRPMSDTRWVALHCGEETQALLENHPNAFLLLTVSAIRAKWKDCPITGLKAGEAFIGDWKSAGLHSEKSYRHAKEILARCGLATFKGRPRGTVVSLVGSKIFSITAEARGGRTGELGADEGRARGGRGATNHTDRQTDGQTDTDEEELLILGSESLAERDQKPFQGIRPAWRKLSPAEQKRKRVEANSPTMEAVGKIMARKATTLWTVAEAIQLETVNPSPDEIQTLLKHYSLALPKGEDYRRQSIETLLNNWNSEQDKARTYAMNQGAPPKAGKFKGLQEQLEIPDA